MSNASCKHGVIDQGKYKKQESKQKRKERKYHVQDNADVAHRYVKIVCDANQFPSLQFCGPHTKAHGVIRLSKHHHIRFGPKLGYALCIILQITCSCAECTSMLDKPWVPGFSPQQQPRYQPVHDFTCWPLLGCFNKWNIITLSHKSKTSEHFEEIHKVIIDVISDNMASLVQSVKYGTINTTYSTTMGYNGIKFSLKPTHYKKTNMSSAVLTFL